MTNLLDILETANRPSPLAERLRPQVLSDYVGQASVIGEESPLRQLVENHQMTSLLFWGPPGVGKTTLARLIAQNSSATFIQLSAVASGVADLREVVKQAKERLRSGQATVLFIDEIHRYSKSQQDAVLPYVEDGTIILMGATTENPAFNVIPALMSRMLLVRLHELSREDMGQIFKRALQFLSEKLGPVTLSNDAKHFLLDYANGDARSGINLLDVAVQCAKKQADGTLLVDTPLLEALAQQHRLNYDRQGDAHYDHASAYQKSMRGSDANAAIYWLAKMIASGEDPRFIARRLVITASEDVGNADPHAFLIASAAADAVERLGLPEARIALAQATIYVAQAPKSNQAIMAIDSALSDITRHGKNYNVPAHLRDSHYKQAETFGHGVGYQYSHDHPEQAQRFLPDELPTADYVKPISKETP